MLWIEGVVTSPDSDQKNVFHVVLNDKQAAAFNKPKQLCIVGDLPEALDLVSEPLKTVVMAEFLHPEPFSDELNADSRTYQGKKQISGTECYVIDVLYAGGEAQSRWYFGVKDNLPHRVDRYYPSGEGKIYRVLELSDIEVLPKLDDASFAIEVPDGYQKREYSRPEKKRARKTTFGTAPYGRAGSGLDTQIVNRRESDTLKVAREDRPPRFLGDLVRAVQDGDA